MYDTLLLHIFVYGDGKLSNWDWYFLDLLDHLADSCLLVVSEICLYALGIIAVLPWYPRILLWAITGPANSKFEFRSSLMCIPLHFEDFLWNELVQVISNCSL